MCQCSVLYILSISQDLLHKNGYWSCLTMHITGHTYYWTYTYLAWLLQWLTLWCTGQDAQQAKTSAEQLTSLTEPTRHLHSSHAPRLSFPRTRLDIAQHAFCCHTVCLEWHCLIQPIGYLPLVSYHYNLIQKLFSRLWLQWQLTKQTSSLATMKAN